MRKIFKLFTAALAITLSAALLSSCGPRPATTFVVLDEALDAEQYGIGFRIGDIALGLEVQRIMDEMIQDGKAAEISNKWFGEDILLKNQDFYKETAAPEGDGSLEAIKTKGELILGLDDSFPPMGFRDENNNIVGFDIDLAREVASRMGVKLTLQPINWDSKELELSAGRIDCIWNGMTITDERVANMFFAKAYIANRQIVIVPENSNIKTIANLEGKKVGLQKGSSSLEALNKNPVAALVGSLTELDDNVTVFLELKAGRIDAFVVDEVAGRYIISNN
ncbi:MAG: transporter substrate-binding domain-containing protein [Clostridiales bacterium]|nr:transporter substrate-binding domain-containing protein [Clostridiales bacterium]